MTSKTDRAATNRANSQHSTGPRTESGKQRSSLNALRHGLTAASPVMPFEDRAAFEEHRRSFLAEYQPGQSQLKLQLVQEAPVRYFLAPQPYPTPRSRRL